MCMLILVGLAAGWSLSVAGSPSFESLTLPHAPSRSVQCVWGETELVPVTLTIENDDNENHRLLGGTTQVARCVEIHRTRLVQGQRETLPVSDGLVIPAGSRVTLEPGTNHLVLIGLRADLVQGDEFPLTLHFDRAGEVTVFARVRRRVDAAGSAPLPPAKIGELTVTGVSAVPASSPNPAG
jgi:copper(I)-binding protein